MPKSTSPPSTRKPHEAGDANLLRKKKNADAQAAFRARRQNYISTLEETGIRLLQYPIISAIDRNPVTSLESVVLQLQESSRETRRENMELRQEASRLRYESREREKYWRTLIQTRKPSQATDHHDISPPTLSSPYLGHPTTALLPQQEPYTGSLSYRAPDPSACQEYDSAGNFTNTVAFPNNEDADGSSESLPGRGGKYTAYPYTINGSSRDARWPMPGLAGLNSCERVNQSQSPYMESHSLATSTDVASYPGRYSDERKVGLDSALNNAPYVFPSTNRYQTVADGIPNSRSMSPTTSTTSSATSLPLTSSYQLPFQDTPTGHDRADFDYRSSSLPQCPDVSLHGGLADISLAGQPSDPGGYRLTRRSDTPSGEHHNSEQMLRINSQPDEALRLRGRRNALHPYHRSPSPAPPQLSCTVAVIKAQAFGALRRTRTKTKKSTDGAAKVAQDVLEARGIGVGSAAAKHSGLEDEIDVETP